MLRRAAAVAVAASLLFGHELTSSVALAEASETKVDEGSRAKATVAGRPQASGKEGAEKSAEKSRSGSNQFETYQDLILKAQNLTLQRDRLQASQVLHRGLQPEQVGSPAYKALVRALDELTKVFYSEKAQSVFSAGESVREERPLEAIEQFNEALRMENGNLTILSALARTHLVLSDCDRAESVTRSAESINAYSPHVKLLRLQVFSCRKNLEALQKGLSQYASELEPIASFTQGLQMKILLRDKDLKKARSLLASWEAQSPDYPELYFWKWEFSKQTGTPDRIAAVKYTQLCQNLTPRKRKSYSVDVDLCKEKEAVDTFLKDNDERSRNT